MLPLLHHPIYLCVALSGFPHSAAPVLSGPIRGRICIDLQPPVPGALLLQGLPRSLLPLPSFAALGLPPTPGATDAQCAAQSICHQLSAFSGAMKCGKMGQRGRERMGRKNCGMGGVEEHPPKGEQHPTKEKAPCKKDTFKA